MMQMKIQCQDQAMSSIKVSKTLIEWVREKLDQASNLIKFFKTLTKNIFECAHEYGHPNIIKIKHRIIW